jgi:nicotinamide-nucleotide amidase
MPSYIAVPTERGTAPSDELLGKLARNVGDALLARGWHAATAESCTGGWIAKALTDIQGSSLWFTTGYVTYANEAKIRELGVPEELLTSHGAVSEPVVTAMAAAAKDHARVDVTVAVSGIAGPDGGSAEKPVGTVWFAWAFPEGLKSEARRFTGDREAVRRFAVAYALEGLATCVDVGAASAATLRRDRDDPKNRD